MVGSPVLPNEILRQIFLYCDPATLYTCIRPLNQTWKDCVENELIATHFYQNHWKLGLRVVRKLALDDNQSTRLNALEIQGSEEETSNTATQLKSIVHVIPFKFKGYDPSNASLLFDTDRDWHALFRAPVGPIEEFEQPYNHEEQQDDDEEDDDDDDDDDDDEEVEDEDGDDDDDNSSVSDDFGARAEARADSARLELDFGLVWRFPDDGQHIEPLKDKHGNMDEAAQWGMPDPENGWLSRFYCSNYDVKRQESEPNRLLNSVQMLHSTPLARRVRQPSLHPQLERALSSENADRDENSRQTDSLVWSDEGHEYASFDLSLGIEFFVRRSARANHLLRRLEAEAAQQQQQPYLKSNGRRGKKNKWGGAANIGSSLSSGWATPNEVASPPPSRTTFAVDAPRRLPFITVSKHKHVDSGDSKDTIQTQPEQEPGWMAMTKECATPTQQSSSKMGSRLASLVPSRQGGSLVSSSLSGSSKSRTSPSVRPGEGSRTPRAWFKARLCRAELMPCADDTLVWRDGDKLGQRAHRILDPTRTAPLSQTIMEQQRTLTQFGIPSPAIWNWSRFQ